MAEVGYRIPISHIPGLRYHTIILAGVLVYLKRKHARRCAFVWHSAVNNPTGDAC